MNYREILNKHGAKILITGDSLSYNRYGYDPKVRNYKDAYDYGVGMQSWSFALRDSIYAEDDSFLYGSDIHFNCKAVDGIDNDSDVPNTAMFNGKIKTLYPEKEVVFDLPIAGTQVVLYLQTRVDHPCVFDVVIDDRVALTDVDTTGDINYFAGYALKILPLSCEYKEKHTVKFINIRGKKITVAAAGSCYREITLNGRGGESTDFFIENFEQRIGQYDPDLILLSLTANDRIKIAPNAMRIQLLQLFSMIFSRFPHTKVLFLTPPSTHDPLDPEKDVGGFTSLTAAEVYNRTAQRVCTKMGEDGYNDFGLTRDVAHNIEVFHISSLFDNDNVSAWRFDNVHLNRQGNDILYLAMLYKLGLERKG